MRGGGSEGSIAGEESGRRVEGAFDFEGAVVGRGASWRVEGKGFF